MKYSRYELLLCKLVDAAYIGGAILIMTAGAIMAIRVL